MRPRYVVVRSGGQWKVYDRVGQRAVLVARYRDCLTYAQKANKQLELLPATQDA